MDHRRKTLVGLVELRKGIKKRGQREDSTKKISCGIGGPARTSSINRRNIQKNVDLKKERLRVQRRGNQYSEKDKPKKRNCENLASERM